MMMMEYCNALASTPPMQWRIHKHRAAWEGERIWGLCSQWGRRVQGVFRPPSQKLEY